MEVIEFPGYIEEEKIKIAQRFLISRQLEEHGLAQDQIRLPVATLKTIIREYTYEAGVRNLERVIANIMTFQNGHRPPDRVIPAML